MARDREKKKAYDKARYKANREKILAQHKEYSAKKDPEKKKAYQKAYYEANRKKVLAKQKTYRETNREKILANVKAWYKANREELLVQRNTHRKANSEKIAARQRAYAKANPEKVAAKGKRYRESNREKIAARVKAWYEINRERAATTSREWYKANRERVKRTTEAYRKAHPEIVSEYSRRRRAQKKNATVPLTANEKEAMRVLGRTRLNLQEQTGREHDIDHIVPLDHGGIHHPCNLRVLDALDNNTKYNKITTEALALVGENYRLYRERIGLEKAEWFRNEIAQAIGLEMANRLIDSPDGAVTPTAPTLEDLIT